jgi:hypothetical protein
MGLNLVYIDGQTPLGEEEKEGLRIKTISTREELSLSNTILKKPFNGCIPKK